MKLVDSLGSEPEPYKLKGQSSLLPQVVAEARCACGAEARRVRCCDRAFHCTRPCRRRLECGNHVSACGCACSCGCSCARACDPGASASASDPGLQQPCTCLLCRPAVPLGYLWAGMPPPLGIYGQACHGVQGREGRARSSSMDAHLFNLYPRRCASGCATRGRAGSARSRACARARAGKLCMRA